MNEDEPTAPSRKVLHKGKLTKQRMPKKHRDKPATPKANFHRRFRSDNPDPEKWRQHAADTNAVINGGMSPSRYNSAYGYLPKAIYQKRKSFLEG